MIVLSQLHLWLHGFDELQYVVAVYLAVREKAVNRILLVVKHFEHRFQFCCREQFDMCRFDIEDCQGPPAFRSFARAKRRVPRPVVSSCRRSARFNATRSCTDFTRRSSSLRKSRSSWPNVRRPFRFRISIPSCSRPMISSDMGVHCWRKSGGYSRVTRSQDLSVLNLVIWPACRAVPAPRSFS